MNSALLAAVLVCCLSWCWSAAAWAWSARGHSEIAAQAFEGLDLNQQQVLEQVLAAGPWGSRERNSKTKLRAAAVWPDRVREQTLQQLFKRHGSGKVPSQLREYRNETTAQWHYVNARFLTTTGRWVAAGSKPNACPPQARGDLSDVWPQLLSAYSGAQDLRDKAILLAFVMHLAGDAYQPLHVSAALDENCRDDGGGNGYCVVESGRRCKVNLHQLWDRGFGVFDGDWYAPTPFRGDVRSLSNSIAADPIPGLYPNNPHEALSATYQRKAARYVEQQASLAVAHLRQALMGLRAN